MTVVTGAYALGATGGALTINAATIDAGSSSVTNMKFCTDAQLHQLR